MPPPAEQERSGTPEDAAAARAGEQSLQGREYGGQSRTMPGPMGPNQVTELMGDPGAEDPREAADGGGAAGAVIGTAVGGPIGLAVGAAVGEAMGGGAGAATRPAEQPDDRVAQAAEADARAGTPAGEATGADSQLHRPDPRAAAEQAARDGDRGGTTIGDDVPGPDGSDPT